MCLWYQMCKFQTQIGDCLEWTPCDFVDCKQTVVTKPLPEPVFTKIFDATWRHRVTMGEINHTNPLRTIRPKQFKADQAHGYILGGILYRLNCMYWTIWDMIYAPFCLGYTACAIPYALHRICYTQCCILYGLYCMRNIVYAILNALYCMGYTACALLYVVWALMYGVHHTGYITYAILYALYCMGYIACTLRYVLY